MLLPSAFSCDQKLTLPKPQKPQRPKLPSFERYDPVQRSHSPMVGLIASCRALHGILGERLSATPSPSLETTRATKLVSNSPFGAPTPPPVRAAAPRGQNKRTRDDFEDDDKPSRTYEGNQSQDYQSNLYSTPKRQRRIPLELPAGLLASDFEALGAATPRQQARMRTPRRSIEISDVPSQRRTRRDLQSSEIIVSLEPPPILHENNQHNDWTERDDRLLVETVLSKLSLSKRDWNDCAWRLGKDKDTLGRRWQSLLGEGNVGLRRGIGRMERPDLDIRSW